MGKKKKKNRNFTSSYFWVRVSLSSSDMSGLRTAIVSYGRSPGGHCGSSLSSRAVKPRTAEDGGSPSDPNPPSKNDPEKSKLWALTETPGLVLLKLRTGFDLIVNGFGLRAKGMNGSKDDNGEIDFGQYEGFIEEDEVGELRVQVSVEDAIAKIGFGNQSSLLSQPWRSEDSSGYIDKVEFYAQRLTLTCLYKK